MEIRVEYWIEIWIKKKINSLDLESLIMINRAYDMMNNINALVNDGEDIYDAELEVSIFFLPN